MPTSSFPADPRDWRGRFVLDLSTALARRGHELVHVVPDQGGGEREEGLGPGLAVRRFPFGPRFARGLVMGQGIGANLRRAPWRLAALPALLAGFRRELAAELEREPRPVILSHWVFPAGHAASRVRRRLPTRHVTVVHGGALQNLLAWPGGRALLADWAAGCDGALYVSEDLRRRARERLGRAAPPDAVSTMGVVPGRFGPRRGRDEARRALGLDPERRLVLAAGRLLPLKGFDLLVAAAAGIEDLDVVIAGEGPEGAALARQARRLGVSLRLAGVLGPEELGLAMDAADRLVVPSRCGLRGRSEGTPVVALEALARGLGVIASGSGGLPELLAGRPDCVLFPVADHRALAELLARLPARRDPHPTAIESAVHDGAPWDYTRISGLVEELLRVGGGER